MGEIFDRIPRFKSCCVYVPLRKATSIVIWFSVIVSVLYILVSAVLLFTDLTKKSESEDYHKRPSKEDSNVYLWLALFTGFVSLLASCVGVYGIRRNEPTYVKTFLIWNGIHLTIEIIVALVNTNILLLLIFAFKSYLWLIVFSYYKDMCEEKQYVAPTST